MNNITLSLQITVPTSDFIDLYSNEMAALKLKIEMLTEKYDKVSNEVIFHNIWIFKLEFNIQINFFSSLGLRAGRSQFATASYNNEMVGARSKSSEIERNVCKIIIHFDNIPVRVYYNICFRLISDKEKLSVIVTSLRSNIKSSLGENEDTIRRLGHEKNLVAKRNKEMVKMNIKLSNFDHCTHHLLCDNIL